MTFLTVGNRNLQCPVYKEGWKKENEKKEKEKSREEGKESGRKEQNRFKSCYIAHR